MHPAVALLPAPKMTRKRTINIVGKRGVKKQDPPNELGIPAFYFEYHLNHMNGRRLGVV